MSWKILLIVAALPISATAQVNPRPEDNKWFATVQYGRADVDTTLARGAWWGRVDDSGRELGIGAGYDLIPQLGARVMYRRIADIDAANACPPGRVCPAIVFQDETRGDLWSASIIPKWQLNESWEIYAVLGALRWDLDPDGNIGGDHGTDFLYGDVSLVSSLRDG